MWRTDWSLGHFTSWTLKLLKFHLVFTFSSLPLDCKKCEEHLGYFVIVFTTYVWHGPGGDQVEDWAQTRTSPSLWTRHHQAARAEHSLFWASLLSLGRECEYSTPGWGGTGLSWTRIRRRRPSLTLLTLCDTGSSLCADVAHIGAMTVKVCVHSPKHYLNEHMTTGL